MKKNKILLIGWDAADWKIIGPLLSQGKMPALKRLIDQGVYGNMSTMNPPFSPMLWSTVATGKTPDNHGVLGFIELMPDLKGVRPVTVNSRKCRALWNIFHNQGLKSNVVGWWPSDPPEPINGVVVSDKFQKVGRDVSKRTPIQPNCVHPQSLLEDLKDLKMYPDEITEEFILPFIPNAHKIDLTKSKQLNSFAKIFSENVSIHNAATHLLRTTQWDFMAVYYDMIDHFCHAFMKFYPPKLQKIPKDLFDIYQGVIEGAYRFQDMMLERTIQLAGKDTTIIVMSDHGYESGSKRILKMPKYPAAPALEHRQFGIFVASGPNIKTNEKVFGLGLVDVAPTILHMYDLPIGRDMNGKVALDIFKETKEVKFIDSWEEVPGDFAQRNQILSGSDQLSDQDALEHLIELGYIERPDEKIEHAVLKTKCDLKHNLARVYMGKKAYNQSLDILHELIKAPPPVDRIPYFLDLIKVYIKLKEFKTAETFFNELKVLDKQFEVNTYLLEAQILKGVGKPKQALNLLIESKNKKPNAENWFQIGKIYLEMYEFDKAQHAFQEALKLEVDSAKYHQAMAECFLRLNKFEDAAEHAITAIDLVKYFSKAHYTLGEALLKLGDPDNAKLAFDMASRLKSGEHERAQNAIENIERSHQSSNLKLGDTNHSSPFSKDQIIVVSGLPRSGTSLMMQMLNEGGVQVLTDGHRKADTSNPKGYFEFDPVKTIHKDNSWLGKAQNKAVKIVAPHLKFLDPQFRYKVIFLSRDISEVIQSQQKMIGKDPHTIPISLLQAYTKILNQVEVWKDKEPSVEFLTIAYRDLLFDAKNALMQVQEFLGIDNLDISAMANIIDTNLYRNRKEEIN